MPELPEVETICRGLEGSIIGARIEKVRLLAPVLVRNGDPGRFRRKVQGKRIEAVARRGKYLIVRFDSGDHLVIHLKMSGSLLLVDGKKRREKTTRAIFSLDDGRKLLFNDTRKFGELYAVSHPSDVSGIARLGPEPLSAQFTLGCFRKMLERRTSKIKPLLMDQTFIAGIGNIYANESLHLAQIHPERKASSFTPAEVAGLYRMLRKVLRRAIRLQGTSFDSFYRDASGRPGRFAEELAVYGRDGEECARCGSEINRSEVGGRGTFYCPECQR